jgi:hypothetical protein
LYPHDIRTEMMTDEDGNKQEQYSYHLLRVPDVGQQIEDVAAFALENYAELRACLYAPTSEQLDMQYHGTWDAHVAAVKAAFPKPEA